LVSSSLTVNESSKPTDIQGFFFCCRQLLDDTSYDVFVKDCQTALSLCDEREEDGALSSEPGVSMLRRCQDEDTVTEGVQQRGARARRDLLG
jgi:hypothetical protein